MKLVLTLLVRNEEDILRENILYHLNRGVDRIIVTDNNSEDGTLDIINDFVKKDVLDLIIEKDDDYSQWKWVTRMASMAIEQHHADWIIHSDADEFWWPEEGDLKTVLEAVSDEYKVVEVPRNDFIPRPESEGTLFDRMIIKNLKSVNHIGKPLPLKICHRAIPDVIVGQGNHKLLNPPGLDVYQSPLLEILHFPLRSYNQFKNKIAMGGAAYERNVNLPKTTAQGWRILYEEYKKGLLPDYYQSKVLTEKEIIDALNEGHFCRDERLRKLLQDQKIIN